LKKNRGLIVGAVIILNLLIPIFYGCRPEDIKEDKLYVIDEKNKQSIEMTDEKSNDSQSVNIQFNTEGSNPFIMNDKKKTALEKYQAFIGDTILKDSRAIPITISEDGNTLFVMEYISNELTDFMRWQLSSTNSMLPIKGKTETRINLFKIDLNKKEVKSVFDNINLISLVKWNNDGSMAAFLSGEHLFVYDLEGEKILFSDINTTNDNTTYFSWGPDGNKIYTEGPNLVNGSIYYIDSEKLVRAYETKEKLYYKGRLNESYYFATLRETDEWKLKYGNAPEYRTTIVNKEGNIIKELGEGRFREVFNKSILQVGESGFGLYYYPDFEMSDDVKTLTEEYIYYVRFVDGGKIAYIVKDKDKVEENKFILNIVDTKGNEINKFIIKSSQISVSLDGRYGIIPKEEYTKIDFEKCALLDIKGRKENKIQEMSKREAIVGEIIKTVRGAMDTYLRFEINREKGYEAIKKYFANNLEQEQAAAYDMKFMLDDIKDMGIKRKSSKYNINLYLDRDLRIYDDGKRASVKVRCSTSNSFGTGMGITHALELIKKEDRWYVMGFSTFPDSKKTKHVRSKVLKYIEEMKKGTLFDGRFKGKDVNILQIQFWRMSDPHLSPDIDTANFSKVYLGIQENGKETIYKMILDNKNYKDWKPIDITNERLGMFF